MLLWDEKFLNLRRDLDTHQLFKVLKTKADGRITSDKLSINYYNIKQNSENLESHELQIKQMSDLIKKMSNIFKSMIDINDNSLMKTQGIICLACGKGENSENIKFPPETS